MANNNKITAAIFSFNNEVTKRIISRLDETNLVDKTIIISDGEVDISDSFSLIKSNYYFSGDTISKVVNQGNTKYLFLINAGTDIELSTDTIKSFIKQADKTNAGWLYSDYFDKQKDKSFLHQLIDYQTGSVRDDFDFGSCFLINAEFAKDILNDLLSVKKNLLYSGLYDLRLSLSRKYFIHRISQPLYFVIGDSELNASNKMFDYVDPRNRGVQIEMEEVVTHHLKMISAHTKSELTKSLKFENEYKFEASVIIPVKNRINTIEDSINSALKQKTKSNFNIIIVDNHSSDGTTGIIERMAKNNNKVILLIPERDDLEIGGCWNEAISHPDCGKFVIQLDSDDLYSDENSLQKIINKFYEENCAMVIGSYKLTDYELNEIPPGIVDHREWTDENGPNNALRVNGLGAPRAFYTPVTREIKFPNVSYGEDYAMGLAVSRQYKVGRIYEAIYLCRRWEGNTDSSLSVERQNSNNYYKDLLRSKEIMVRRELNKSL